MSHFAVLVIGDGVAGQLAPYHEFESTGIVNEFVVTVDETAEHATEFAEFERDVAAGFEETAAEWMDSNYGRTVVALGEDPDLEREHKYGWCRVDVNGNLIESCRRTNPNAQWDWYVIGGRWNDTILLKDGSKSNSAVIEDIDFEKQAAIDEARARTEFRAWRECFDPAQGLQAHLSAETGLAIQPKDLPRSWREILHGDGTIDEKRAMYHAQPAIKAAKHHPLIKGRWTLNPVEEMGFDEEAYVERERLSTLIPYALVHEGKWSAKGSMGWWGFSFEEIDDPLEWPKKVCALLHSLPDGTRITVVDCHT